YYSSQTTPSYPYAYLLTYVLPPDYVDVSGNGVSPDDMGNYTQFNYSTQSSDYPWRTPYNGTPYLASNQPGSSTTNNDDKGTIVYGKKEIWYLHSIESRTMYAQFFLNHKMNPREDGLGVDENGQTDPSQKLRFLDSI